MSYGEQLPGFPKKLIYAWFRDPSLDSLETLSGRPLCVHFKTTGNPHAKIRERRSYWEKRQANELGTPMWTPDQREELMSLIGYRLEWRGGHEFLYRRIRRIPRSLVLSTAGAVYRVPHGYYRLFAPPRVHRHKARKPLPIKVEAPKTGSTIRTAVRMGGPNPDILQMIETMGNRWFD